jgi:hypothetical protein
VQQSVKQSVQQSAHSTEDAQSQRLVAYQKAAVTIDGELFEVDFRFECRPGHFATTISCVDMVQDHVFRRCMGAPPSGHEIMQGKLFFAPVEYTRYKVIEHASDLKPFRQKDGTMRPGVLYTLHVKDEQLCCTFAKFPCPDECGVVNMIFKLSRARCVEAVSQLQLLKRIETLLEVAQFCDDPRLGTLLDEARSRTKPLHEQVTNARRLGRSEWNHASPSCSA